MELSHSDSSDRTGRNTRYRPRSRARTFLGTLNNPSSGDVAHFGALLSSLGAKKWAYQLEKGESEGTQHIQFVVQFPHQKEFSVLKNAMPRAHLEASRNPIASFNYCTKEKTRVEGPWIEGEWVQSKKRERPERSVEAAVWEVDDEKEILGEKTLYEWQEELISLYDDEPDDRTIYWFSDTMGGKGKTWLARYMVVKYRPNIIMVNGKAGDMKYAVASHLRAHHKLRAVIVNIPRSTAEVAIPSLIAGVEQIKDGIFFNSKYESAMAVFKHVHVFVFANMLPPGGLLSEDRLKVKDLDLLE